MERIKIGRVSGAQGLRGEIKIYHDSRDEEAIKRLTSLVLCRDGAFPEYSIEGLRMHKLTPIVKLSGVDGRDAAEALVGAEVYAWLSEARPREDGAWLAMDLIGLRVRLAGEADAVYSLKGVIDNPAHSILEIETDRGVRMLPFIDLFVQDVDAEAGIVVISPPEGWLD